MFAPPLTGHALQRVEMEYHGKFGNTIGRIQHIALMSIIGICYTDYHISTQTVAPTFPSFQGLKRCIQYLDSHPHTTIFYPYIYYDSSSV